jgi:P-type E1-E2 ATPase
MYYNKQMLEIIIPGKQTLHLDYLVCDINGTLTLDGQMIPGVAVAIESLKHIVEIHLLTADTLRRADDIAVSLGIQLQKIAPGSEALNKADYIHELGEERIVAIGQGANDALMLKQAALGICVLSAEGTAVATLVSADLVVPDVLSALELLLNPTRIAATLRE